MLKLHPDRVQPGLAGVQPILLLVTPHHLSSQYPRVLDIPLGRQLLQLSLGLCLSGVYLPDLPVEVTFLCPYLLLPFPNPLLRRWTV